MSLTTSSGKATVGQVCEAFGISRQAYYAARKAPAAKASDRRCERRGPWVADATLCEQIRDVVAEFPAWGVRKVWAYLRRLGTIVSRKRVWKRMRAMGLTLPPVSERAPEVPRGQVVVPDSNRRWATDLTTVWTAEDGTLALVPVIDCGDRVVFEIADLGVHDRPKRAVAHPEVSGQLDRGIQPEFRFTVGTNHVNVHSRLFSGKEEKAVAALSMNRR